MKPVMPRVLTTVSSMVKHPETSTWHVRMGDDVPKLLYAHSPARIVLYNYNVVREMWHARNMLLSRRLFLVFVSRECIVIV